MPSTGTVLYSATESRLVEAQPESKKIPDATKKQKQRARNFFTKLTLALVKKFVQKKFSPRGFHFLCQSDLLHASQ